MTLPIASAVMPMDVESRTGQEDNRRSCNERACKDICSASEAPSNVSSVAVSLA